MGKKHVKSDEVVPTDSDEEQKPPAKQAKKDKSKETASGDFVNDSEGNYAVLSALRRVTVRTYNKKVMIDLREYYTDKASGEEKPGKKGISLSIEQWETIKKLTPQIDAEVEKLSG